MSKIVKLRAHFAARAIVHYISSGRFEHTIKPIVDHELFDFYETYRWTSAEALPPKVHKLLAVWTTIKCRDGISLDFKPIEMLLRLHSEEERTAILEILEGLYGFNRYGYRI